jgi:hypothetical protein
MGKSDIYVARVKGTYGIRPRGYVWTRLAWAVILGVGVGAVGIGYLFGVGFAVVIIAAGVVTVLWMSQRKPRVFRASAEGLQLGGARDNIWLPWDDIWEVKISPQANGALVDVLVGPGAILGGRGLPPTAEILLSCLPGSYRFLTPPLLKPLTDPPRYSAPLWGVTDKDVADGLQRVVPDSVVIRLAGQAESAGQAERTGS